MKTTIETREQQDVKDIEQTVIDFARAADNRDRASLDRLMHPEFRSVVNRLMGSDSLSVMNKSTYLGLLDEGKIGGSKREIEIVSVDVINYNASVRVTLKGSVMTFYSLFHLTKNKEGVWLIINDLPFVVKNN